MDDKVKAIQERLRATFDTSMATGQRFEGIPFIAFDEVAGAPTGTENLVANVTKALKARGWHVANVRRLSEASMPTDDGMAPLMQAGSETTVLTLPGRIVVSRPVPDDEMLEAMSDAVRGKFDIVLGENFGFATVPRILVTRRVQEGFNLGLPNIVAYVSDNALDVVIPRFSASDVEALADLIERTLGLNSAQRNSEE